MININLVVERFSERHRLSKREREVIVSVLELKSQAAEISRALQISVNTVKIHLTKICAKVGVASKTDVVTKILLFAVELETTHRELLALPSGLPNLVERCSMPEPLLDSETPTFLAFPRKSGKPCSIPWSHTKSLGGRSDGTASNSAC